jgi:hypothetical protein
VWAASSSPQKLQEDVERVRVGLLRLLSLPWLMLVITMVTWRLGVLAVRGKAREGWPHSFTKQIQEPGPEKLLSWASSYLCIMHQHMLEALEGTFF